MKHDKFLSSSLMPDVGVVGIVPDNWDFPWMVRHHVMSRLAKYFQVLWLNPPLDRRQLWRMKQLPRISRLEKLDSFQGTFLNYSTGCMTPLIYRPKFLASFFARKRIQSACQILRRRGCSKIVLYVWRPEDGFALSAAQHDVSCYHIDDEYSFSEVEQAIEDDELHLIRRVDQVFIHSPALMEKKGHYNPNTELTPNGVSFEVFSQVREQPKDLSNIPRPRIGYVGYIKRQLDFDLLLLLAKSHKEYSFVLVGPIGVLGDEAPKVEELRQLANVFFLGAKPPQELGAYIQHMDVSLLCYRNNDYTKYINPMKLHEYLATGRPVVASPIRSLLGLSDVLTFADSPELWSAAITENLGPSATAEEQISKRKEVARQHDWGDIVAGITQNICRHLGTEYLEKMAHFRFDEDTRSAEGTSKTKMQLGVGSKPG